jgi:hypothetical protein
MILICEYCGQVKTNVFKIPTTAFYVQDNFMVFPNKRYEKTTNICTDCLEGSNNEK